MLEHVLEVELAAGRAMPSSSNMAGQGEGIYASSTSIDVAPQQAGQIGLTISPKTKSGTELPLEACMTTDQDFEDALKQFNLLSAQSEGSLLSFPLDKIHSCYQHDIYDPGKTRKLFENASEPSFQQLSSSPAIWDKLIPLDAVEVEDDHHPPHGKTEFDGKAEPELVILEKFGDAPSRSCEISVAGSVCEAEEFSLKGQSIEVQYDLAYQTSASRLAPRASLKVTSLDAGQSYEEINLPIHSKAKGKTSVDYSMDVCSSKTLDVNGAKLWGVPTGLRLPFSQTNTGTRGMAANHIDRNCDTPQDKLPNSLPQSRTLSQKLTVASIASLFQQNSQEALFEAYSRSLSTHSIPPVLRKRFDSLLRRYQSDEHFRGAVAAYAMELSGAVPPDETDPIVLGPRLRGALQVIYDKCTTEEDFRTNLEQYLVEFLRYQEPYNQVPSEEIQPNDDTPGGGFKRKVLDGLSTTEIIKYCRRLEDSRAKHAQARRRYGELYRNTQLKSNGTPRMRHHPEEPNPKGGNWTCFHPQRKDKTIAGELCGRSNPYYEKKLIWKQVTRCKHCLGLYDEGFELQKLTTPKRNYFSAKRYAKEMETRAASQSPAVNEANYPINDQINNFNGSMVIQDPVLRANSGKINDQWVEDRRIDAHGLSTEYHSGLNETQSTTLSGRLLSTQTVLGFSDDLSRNMDLDEEDAEFDMWETEFDPEFTNMEMEPNLQHARSYPEENFFPQNFLQNDDNIESFGNHYPEQVNLFAQHMDSHIPTRTSMNTLYPSPRADDMSYGAGFASAPPPDQPYGTSRTLLSTLFEGSHGLYQSPYAPLESFDEVITGTVSSIPHSNNVVSQESMAPGLSDMHASLSSLQPENVPSWTPRSRKATSGRGQGWNKSLSPKRKKYPPKTPRPSRSKAAIAQRAASKEMAPKPQVLTKLQIDRVQAVNSTAAVFLPGRRKSWEPPRPQHPSKIVIAISDNNEGQKANDGVAQKDGLKIDSAQSTQGVDSDQDRNEFEDDILTAEFNAEFDRQDRAAKHYDSDQEEDELGDDMMTDDFNDDFACQGRAAAPTAEESEESEEE